MVAPEEPAHLTRQRVEVVMGESQGDTTLWLPQQTLLLSRARYFHIATIIRHLIAHIPLLLLMGQ